MKRLYRFEEPFYLVVSTIQKMLRGMLLYCFTHSFFTLPSTIVKLLQQGSKCDTHNKMITKTRGARVSSTCRANTCFYDVQLLEESYVVPPLLVILVLFRLLIQLEAICVLTCFSFLHAHTKSISFVQYTHIHCTCKCFPAWSTTVTL